MNDEDKKLKGFSPYNDNADNYNISVNDIMSEAQLAISDKNKAINYVILSFVKLYDFAQSRKEEDYKEAKRLLNITFNLLGIK